MKINLLTDAPKHNYALMKISTYHKERGDTVSLNFPLMPADYTYVSLLFAKNIGGLHGDIYGGPAFYNITDQHAYEFLLNPDIKCCRPDRELFNLDYSVGYSFRPCYRNCSFCKIGIIQHPDTVHYSIWEFHDSRFSKICLLNNNTFFDKQWKETFEEIWDADLTVIDENGYDLRLVDDEKAEALKRTKFQGQLHFAWDRMQDEKDIISGLKLLKKTKIHGTVYVLIGYDTTEADDIYRCQIIKEYGQTPYIMPYMNENGKNTWQARKFKRFIDSFMWRKYKTIKEAWRNYNP